MALTEKFLFMHGLKTHQQKVKSLYKRALRSTQSFMHHRGLFRFEAAKLRARFDHNKDIKNQLQATELLRLGEEELFRYGHWNVRHFMQSPGGTCHEREVIIPDWVLDFWHPLEKAMYPEYFALRECRKKCYAAFWEEHIGADEKPDLKELLEKEKEKEKKKRSKVCHT